VLSLRSSKHQLLERHDLELRKKTKQANIPGKTTTELSECQIPHQTAIYRNAGNEHNLTKLRNSINSSKLKPRNRESRGTSQNPSSLEIDKFESTALSEESPSKQGATTETAKGTRRDRKGTQRNIKPNRSEHREHKKNTRRELKEQKGNKREHKRNIKIKHKVKDPKASLAPFLYPRLTLNVSLDFRQCVFQMLNSNSLMHLKDTYLIVIC